MIKKIKDKWREQTENLDAGKNKQRDQKMAYERTQKVIKAIKGETK